MIYGDEHVVTITSLSNINKAIFYIPKISMKQMNETNTKEDYNRARQLVLDAQYGYNSAVVAAEFLRLKGWQVEVLWVKSLDDFAWDMEERAKQKEEFSLLATVSHSCPLGPFFDNPNEPEFDSSRAYLNAGWNWYAPGYVLEKKAGLGVASVKALCEITERMKEIVVPDGVIMFIGCTTGKPTKEPKNQSLPDPRKQGTPFWIEDGCGLRYSSYVHAVADTSQRAVLGNKGGTDLGTSKLLVKQVFMEHKIPQGWILITPEHAKD